MSDKLNDLKAKREEAKKAVQAAKKEMHDECMDTKIHGCMDAWTQRCVSLCFQAAKGLSIEDLKLVIQAKDKVEADGQAGFLSFLCAFVFSSALFRGRAMRVSVLLREVQFLPMCALPM